MACERVTCYSGVVVRRQTTFGTCFIEVSDKSVVKRSIELAIRTYHHLTIAGEAYMHKVRYLLIYWSGVYISTINCVVDRDSLSFTDASVQA